MGGQQFEQQNPRQSLNGKVYSLIFEGFYFVKLSQNAMVSHAAEFEEIARSLGAGVSYAIEYDGIWDHNGPNLPRLPITGAKFEGTMTAHDIKKFLYMHGWMPVDGIAAIVGNDNHQ